MAKIDELIEYLRGTCNQETEAIPRIYGDDYDSFVDLTRADLCELDDAIFLCAGCGWWCDMDEEHEDDGESVCRSCAQERGIDDD